MNKKLLENKQVLDETIWLIALHIEKFVCKNNTLPCNHCRNEAIKLAPLFLIGIEGIAEKIFRDPVPLAHIALDKIGRQKWEITRPWRQNSWLQPKEQKPITENTVSSLLGKLNNLISPKKEIPYKLATRIPTREKE